MLLISNCIKIFTPNTKIFTGSKFKCNSNDIRYIHSYNLLKIVLNSNITKDLCKIITYLLS